MAETATISEAVARPDYVPESVVFDFDMYRDPAFCADPHKRVLELQQQAPPIFWTPRNKGHWIFQGHAANFEAARDTEGFSSEIMPQEQIQAMLAQLPPGSPHIPQAFPINLDPPMHGIYRRPLQGVFSPKTINALQDSIRALAGELIDAVAADGQCEFMSAIAEPLPVKVFLKMLGLPLERMAEYRELVKGHLGAIEIDPALAMQALIRVAESMRPTMLERKENPQDDILSMLWQVEIDGKPTTIEDMENYGVLLFIAGLDTVMNGMGHGVRHLATDPAAQDEVRANPELVPELTEELLRRYTFTIPVRRVSRDMNFQGVDLHADDRVMLFLPGADLDATEYPDAEKFDMHRSGPAHIAFNAGPHRCLGSHLARVELQILYEEMLRRLPPFKLDPERPPVFHSGHVVGLDTLHLVWEA